MNDLLYRAREALSRAEALLVTAGAGMGVDSGLPDYRGNQGFWKAYPLYARLGLEYASVATPEVFERDPHFGWGFYGHRRTLYQHTKPHDGFDHLRQFGERLPGGYFVYTSNVDGQFEAAGFDANHICECHGSIHHLQCVRDCCKRVFPMTQKVEVDLTTMRATDPLPHCPDCGGLARPAINLFDDQTWNDSRSYQQYQRYEAWLTANQGRRLVIVEIGAGTTIPSIRSESETVTVNRDGFLIRINPREAEITPGTLGVGIAVGGQEALQLLFQ